MAVIGVWRLAWPLAILAAALLPAIAYAGDEDSKPAYMIYIDPETGKYTTEDPETANMNTNVVPAEPMSGNSQPKKSLLIVVGGALVALLVGGLIQHQRGQIT